MKKKIVAMCATVAIAAVAVGGTLAYFTDQTKAVENVMTTGNVKIAQIEEERGADGALTGFTQNQKLFPYTGPVDANGMAVEYTETLTIDGEEYSMFDQGANAIDKIVTVKNEGTEACYVRTLFAFEMISDGNGGWISPFANSEKLGGQYLYTAAVADAKNIGMALCTDKQGNLVTFELGGIQYCVAQYDYNGILAEGETTHVSLKQVYLNANADNADVAELLGADGKYSILALSQAVQAEGFEPAEGEDAFLAADAAFSAAFGGIDGNSANQDGVAKLAGWFSKTVVE